MSFESETLRENRKAQEKTSGTLRENRKTQEKTGRDDRGGRIR